MYRSDLKARDRSGALVAVVAVHAALFMALLQLSGHGAVIQPESALRLFDVIRVPPPPPIEPKPVPLRKPRPKAAKAPPSPRNIASTATPVVSPRPHFTMPVPVPMAVAETPNHGVEATQGASDTAGPGTGAGGSGSGTGGGSGNGTGGSYVTGPRLLTPPLTGRDFPRQLLRMWPPQTQVFVRIRVSADGGVDECIIDRGTGIAAIDLQVCAQIHLKFHYRPALTQSGQAVAGWAGYRQVAPR